MRRLSIITLVVGTVLALGGLQPAPAYTDSYLTRVRMVLTHQSDWAGVTIPGTYLMAYKVVSSSPGTAVDQGPDGFDLHGPTPATATVDAVFQVPDGSSFPIQLAKALSGDASVRVTRTNDTSVLVADVYNASHSGSATVTRTVSRSSLVGGGLTIPPVDPQRRVLAFYYPWFNEGDFDTGRWQDTPTGAYAGGNASHVRSMVAQAAGAGIDGFLVSYDGQYDYPQRFDLVLQAAEARGAFTVAPLIELLPFRTSNGFDVVAIEQLIRKSLARSSSAAFQRSAGRPVVFLFGAYQLGASNWSTIRQRLAASGINPFFVGDAIEPGYKFDGYYRYSPNGMSYDAIWDAYAGAANELRLKSMVDPSTPQRLWAATVSPGMNDSYYRPLFPTNQPRNDGARYSMTWDISLATAPEWIVITSWNEFYEATHIQASQKYGTLALDQTRDYAQYFHNPAAAATSAPEQGGGLLSNLLQRGVAAR